MYAKLRSATKDAGPGAVPPLEPSDIEAGRAKWSGIIDKNYDDTLALKKMMNKAQAVKGAMKATKKT